LSLFAFPTRRSSDLVSFGLYRKLMCCITSSCSYTVFSSRVILPAVTFLYDAISDSRVVFPAPFRPSRPYIFPGASSRLMLVRIVSFLISKSTPSIFKVIIFHSCSYRSFFVYRFCLNPVSPLLQASALNILLQILLFSFPAVCRVHLLRQTFLHLFFCIIRLLPQVLLHLLIRLYDSL